MTEEAKKTGPKNNPSLQKKTAARMAAVQCLYMLAVGGEKMSPMQQVLLLKKQLSHNKDEQKLRVGVPLEPNYKLLETLLAGIDQRSSDIDFRLNASLSTEWKRDRMSPLILAILRCAIFEMFFDKEISHKIVIDEYTRLTRHFFPDAEVDFVHGALNTLAQKYAQ